MLHTFVAYVEDRPGVLTRVASLFRRLNINIHSLTVGRSERVGQSRLTMVCEASAEAGNRIRASLYKLEDVIEVDDIAQAPAVTRELVLIKVAATPQSRSRIFELVEVFRARIQPGGDDRGATTKPAQGLAEGKVKIEREITQT